MLTAPSKITMTSEKEVTTKRSTKKGFIQDVFTRAKKKGTLGKCTGDKFGGPSCPPGSKQYNFAKSLRKMAAAKKKKQ